MFEDLESFLDDRILKAEFGEMSKSNLLPRTKMLRVVGVECLLLTSGNREEFDSLLSGWSGRKPVSKGKTFLALCIETEKQGSRYRRRFNADEVHPIEKNA